MAEGANAATDEQMARNTTAEIRMMQIIYSKSRLYGKTLLRVMFWRLDRVNKRHRSVVYQPSKSAVKKEQELLYTGESECDFLCSYQTPKAMTSLFTRSDVLKCGLTYPSFHGSFLVKLVVPFHLRQPSKNRASHFARKFGRMVRSSSHDIN